MLLGLWFFTAIIYQGQLQPKPNPFLQMTWVFEADSNTLRYWRLDAPGFCERTALHGWDPHLQVLRQTITHAHKDNNAECAQDPDMRVGRSSESAVTVSGDVLHLNVPLGEERLTLRFDRLHEPTRTTWSDARSREPATLQKSPDDFRRALSLKF